MLRSGTSILENPAEHKNFSIIECLRLVFGVENNFFARLKNLDDRGRPSHFFIRKFAVVNCSEINKLVNYSELYNSVNYSEVRGGKLPFLWPPQSETENRCEFRSEKTPSFAAISRKIAVLFAAVFRGGVPPFLWPLFFPFSARRMFSDRGIIIMQRSCSVYFVKL